MAVMAMMMAGCSNNDEINAPQPAVSGEGIPFTATISMGSGTRTVLTEGTDDNSKNIINAAWKQGDKVALVYSVGEGKTVVTEATVAVTQGGQALVSATLDKGVTNGANLRIVYPYSAVNSDANDVNYGEAKTDFFTASSQLGTLEDIAGNWDVRSGGSEISVTDGKATLAEVAQLDSDIAIWKLTFQCNPTGQNQDLSVKQLAVKIGSETVATVKPTSNVPTLYMAIGSPCSDATITLEALDPDDDSYFFSKTGITLAEGKYYESTVTMVKGYPYMTWDETEKKLVSAFETNYQEVSSTTTTWDGSKVLVVKDPDVSITTNITLSGNTKIILCDGAKLTTKQIYGSDSYYSLTIYGQSAQTGQLITQPSEDDYGITMVSELNIHGGDISANGYTGVKLYDGTRTLNVYGGKLTVRGSSDHGIYYCKALNILGGTVEAYGGTSIGSGQTGIYMVSSAIITVSNDGRLKAVGGDGTSDGGGNGIIGTLVAKDNAVVEAYGGHANSGNQWGGYGISNGNVEIRDNAHVTCIAGNSTGIANGNHAIPNNVYYYGGTLIAIGGAKGDSSSNDGMGIGSTLINSSGGTIYYATNTDGSLTDFSEPGDLSADNTMMFSPSARGIKVYK